MEYGYVGRVLARFGGVRAARQNSRSDRGKCI